MRALLAIVAFFAFTSFASAGQVINGVKYNFVPTGYDCPNVGPQCPVEGEGRNDNAAAESEGEGEGEGDKH